MMAWPSMFRAAAVVTLICLAAAVPRSGAFAEAPPPADTTLERILDARVKAVRAHSAEMVLALPGVPAEIVRSALSLSREAEEFGWSRSLLLLALALVVGLGAERSLRRVVTGSWRSGSGDQNVDTLHRFRTIAARLAFVVAEWALFSAGTVGTFLALEWPPLLDGTLLSFLLALCGFRGALALSRLVLVPDLEPQVAAQLRPFALSHAAARRTHLFIAVLAGWFAFGKAVVENATILGSSFPIRELTAYTFGIGLLAISLYAVWRGPGSTGAAATAGQQFARRTTATLLSPYLVLLWALWVIGATVTLWVFGTLGALWAALYLTHWAVAHLTRPDDAAAPEAAPAQSIKAICVERALRAVLIIGAMALLANVWQAHLSDLAGADTPLVRVIRIGFEVLVIALVADLAWNLVKALIESQLGALQKDQDPMSEASRRQARLRTLLPISKKIAAVMISFVAILLMLSEAGVQIGPLIAGAGVIGLAVSFGAQTLVRDIFSGFFYLLDDAFRVGEYIQAGNYKGTVESFSIRSVRLRHHRGPLYTVPFGALGAIQNMSRDWVIDILTVGVTYDTDLAAVKKIVKRIGQQLKEDPELGPLIIETLKMQGVQQFGDFAIQIRLKMMTRPGEQFVVRRRAYALIKTEFDAAGIKFAFPTVQLAGGAEATPAVAAAASRVVQLSGTDPAD